MKKAAVLFLTIIFCFSFTGCHSFFHQTDDNVIYDSTDVYDETFSVTWDDVWEMELYDGAFEFVSKDDLSDKTLFGLNKLLAHCDYYGYPVKILSFGVSSVNDREVFAFVVPELCSDVISYIQSHNDNANDVQTAYLSVNVDNNTVESSLESYIASYVWFDELKTDIENAVPGSTVTSKWLWNQEQINACVKHDPADWEWYFNNFVFSSDPFDLLRNVEINVIVQPNLRESQVYRYSNALEFIAEKYYYTPDYSSDGDTATEAAFLSLVVPENDKIRSEIVSDCIPFGYNSYEYTDGVVIVKCV